MPKYNELKFGCEFEFYPNQMLEDEMIEELKSLLKSGIELKMNHQINDDNHMNYKNENSLSATGGKEITVPICTYDELIVYITKIARIIDAYGQTNEDTGFHIHISSLDDSVEVDFYKFMLLSNEASLLTNWGNRNAFCLNVMDVLTVLDLEEAKKTKNKKGRVWNLEKRKENGNTNHIEIRTIGGTNYQQYTKKILQELDQFIEIFKRSIKDENVDNEYKNILEKHYLIVKNAPQARKNKFLQLIN